MSTYAIVLLTCAAWFLAGWWFRARLAVRRGESTARAEREAAIRACARRHREGCIVWQMDKTREWTSELELELLRKRQAKQEVKEASKSGPHRKRSKEDEGMDPR